MNAFCKGGDALVIKAVAKTLEILKIAVHRLANVSRKAAAFGFAFLHGVERSGLGDGEFMQEMLKVAIAGETHAENDAHGGGRIDAQALGQAAHAEKHKLAGIFENRANELLAFAAKALEALPHR